MAVLFAVSFFVMDSSTLEAQLFKRPLFRGQTVYRPVVPNTVSPVLPQSPNAASSAATSETKKEGTVTVRLSEPTAAPKAVTKTAASPAVSVPSQYRNSNWYPYVIAKPEDREWIRETPVELRPNRPLHFWGNSKRRVLR